MNLEEWTNFRSNMRYLRIMKGITGTQMAECLGRTPGFVSCVESGAYTRWPRTQDMLAIAKCLGTTIKEMIKPIPAGTVLYVSPEEQDVGVENLEKIRRLKKLTKQDFAELIGVSLKHYSMVTTGGSTFSVRKWWTIAENLKMDLITLLGRDAE